MKKAPLIISGVLFALVALAHLARLYFQFPITVGDFAVPLNASVIGFIISGLLSAWMFCAATKSQS